MGMENATVAVPCGGCTGKTSGIVGLLKGLIYGPADQATKDARLAVCRGCNLKDTTGARLCREIDGNLFCGMPRLSDLRKIIRDESKDGCGCDLNFKASRREAECPHGKWRVIQPTPQTAAPEGDDAALHVMTLAVDLGEIVISACALAGGRAANPARRIVWSVRGQMIPAARLFPVADEILSIEVGGARFKETRVFPATPETLPAGACRHKHYAKMLGVAPMMPPIELPQAARAAARTGPGFERETTVLLAPLQPNSRHTWPLRRWLELEDFLLSQGHGVVVVDPDPNGALTQSFRAARYFGPGPAQLAAMVERASLVIGGDTAVLHLAGALRTQGIAICGPLSGVEQFGFYPADGADCPTTIQSVTPAGFCACAPCRYAAKSRFSRFCQFSCEGLYAVSLASVIEAVRSEFPPRI